MNLKNGSRLWLLFSLLFSINQISYSQPDAPIAIPTTTSGIYEVEEFSLGKLCPAQGTPSGVIFPWLQWDYEGSVIVNVDVSLSIANASPDALILNNPNISSAVIATVKFSASEALTRPTPCPPFLGVGSSENYYNLVRKVCPRVSTQSFDIFRFVVAYAEFPKVILGVDRSGFPANFRQKIKQLYRSRLEGGGGEFIFCNDGNIVDFVTNFSTNVEPTFIDACRGNGNLLKELSVIGDTGGADVNLDPNDKDCSCESRIENLVFSDFSVFISEPSFESSFSFFPPLYDTQDLIDFYCDFGGENWVRSDNWLSLSNPCSWYGIECDEADNIVGISLPNNFLRGSGPLPLNTLKNVNLKNNRIEQITNLFQQKQIERLDLSSNRGIKLAFACESDLALEYLNLANCAPIDFSIPFHAKNLETIDLSRNDLLDVDYPEIKFGQFKNIYLTANNISIFPPQLLALPQLEVIRLDTNTIQILPAELSRIKNLRRLSMSSSQVQIIEPAAANLPNLELLNLFNNNIECLPNSLIRLCSESVQVNLYLNPIADTWEDFCDNPAGKLCNDYCAPTEQDADLDGYCNSIDCDDSDPEVFPLPLGTPCDDNNPSTTGDVIIGGGCDCAGTPCSSDADGDGICTAADCDDNNTALPGTPGEACVLPSSCIGMVSENGCSCISPDCEIEFTIDEVNTTQCDGSSSVIFTVRSPFGKSQYLGVNITSDRKPFKIYRGNLSSDNPPFYSGNDPIVTALSTFVSDFEITMEVLFEAAGEYSISVFSDRDCTQTELFSINPTDIACPCPPEEDLDLDGFCSDEDCDDNNPFVPGIPGSLCEPADPNASFYRIIDTDGCNCFVYNKICETVGDLNFTTQFQIDDFPNTTAGNCPFIIGDVVISGTNITNLNGLSSITGISGNLIINTTGITDLTGLENLKSIGNNFTLNNNANLTSIDQLTALNYLANQIFISDNDQLLSLGGLEQITSILGNLNILSNDLLTDLTGLDNLESVTGEVLLSNNKSLVSLTGLARLEIVQGDLTIRNHLELNNINGIRAIRLIVGDLDIRNNRKLSDCAVASVCEYLRNKPSDASINQNQSGCNDISEVLNSCDNITISCPTNINIEIPSTASQAIVDYPLPTATSNCDGGIIPPPPPRSEFELLGTLGNSDYYLSREPLNWSEAQEVAEILGGHLVVINSAVENRFISQSICPSGNDNCGKCNGGLTVHIGLTDRNNEGVFEWVNGDPLTFTNWANDYGCTNKNDQFDNPNDNSYGNTNGADYVFLRPYYEGTWGDYNDEIYKRFIVELPNSTNNFTFTRLAGLSSGSTFPLGETTIIYEVTDDCDNFTTCAFQVTVARCTDADNDGVCFADDCNDADPSVPTTPDATCDDGNPSNDPDFIAEDGCTCEGRSVQPNCEVITVSTPVDRIRVANVAAPHAAILVFTANYEQTVFACADWLANTCSSPEDIPLSPGNYVVKVQLFDESWSEICSSFYPVTVSGDFCGLNGDRDGDDVCNIDDCRPDDPTISNPGDTCNDGDPNTFNDMIQSDCSCAGTIPTTPCEELTIVAGSNGFTIQSLSAAHYALKVTNQNFTTELLRCANWESTDCDLPQFIPVPSDGNYIVQLQVYPQPQYSNLTCEINRIVSIGNAPRPVVENDPDCPDGDDLNDNGTADHCENNACDHPDFVPLMALFHATDGNNWTEKSNWGVNCDPCTWAGVNCNAAQRVEQIVLVNNNVKGVLPDLISELSELKEFQIGNSAIGGDLRLAWENLTKLERLRLYQTDIAGAIPSNLGALTKLKELVLFANQIDGTLPVSLANLTQLEQLLLPNNQLQGQLPPEWMALKNLQQLNLAYNELNGEIPVQFSEMSALRELLLDHNQLNGDIPNELANLVNLQQLHLGYNNLTGTLNADLANATGMLSFSVEKNHLNGTVPSELADWTYLQQLNLADNNFTCLPATFTNYCSSNATINISNNQLPANDWAAFCTACTDGDCATGWGECGTSAALAVQTLFFNAKKTKIGTQLNWQITPIYEVDHYTIQHSLDGINWKETAHLTADEQQFIDPTVFYQPVFYRLQIHDLKGKVTHSRMVQIEHQTTVRIYPNPTRTDAIQIELPPTDSHPNLRLRDIHGRLVKNWNPADLPGNTYSLAGLPVGVYLLEVVINDQSEVFKVIKQ